MNGYSAGQIALLPRLLVTAATAAYALGPFVIDMNRTHLLHPAWPGHARLHLMWAAVGQLGVGLIAAALVWWPGPFATERCRLAAALGLCFMTGFFVAAATARWFRGTLHDPRGVPPFHGIDGNLVACTAITGLLVAGLATT